MHHLMTFAELTGAATYIVHLSCKEALAEAQSIAVGNDNQYIEPLHLLAAMLRADDIRLCRSECTALLGGDPHTLPEPAAALSPICHATPTAPPFVLAHGRRDRLVSVEQSRTFHRCLRDLGASARLIELPGLGHDTASISAHPTVRAAQRDLLVRAGFGCG